jgi:predicted glutamine amidotransferase
MYAQDKKLTVKKGYFTFKDFYKEYKPHEDKQVLLHFRIKTHGPIDKNNCHPFLVNSGLGFIHNGIISGYGDNKQSDTIDFNKSILQKIVAKHGNMGLFDDPMVELIENVIGYSKLVFLDRHGNYRIMNEDKGHWNNGVWYSNNSYKKPEPVTYTGYQAWDKQDTHRTSLPVAAKDSCSLASGEWVVCNEDYDYGIGDNTSTIKKGDWVEVENVDSKSKTCTLVTGEYMNPTIYTKVPMSVVESWDDADTYSHNRTFDF